MMDRGAQLPVTRQAELLDLSRASVYHQPRPISQQDLVSVVEHERLKGADVSISADGKSRWVDIIFDYATPVRAYFGALALSFGATPLKHVANCTSSHYCTANSRDLKTPSPLTDPRQISDTESGDQQVEASNTICR